MIRVLIVEDSATVREMLVYILSADPEIQVIGTARNGEEALAAVPRCRPDVVTMDINMPRLNGFEATRRIMESHPTPIVMVSGTWDTTEMATTFHALTAGALAALPRPMGIGHPHYAENAQKLVQTVKMMAEVKVVRRWPHATHAHLSPLLPLQVDIAPAATNLRIVAIGASTGGPAALQTVLGGLPKYFPVPLVIVQHMAADFVPGFVEWLAKSTAHTVQVAEHGHLLLPGQIYVAPGDSHLTVEAGERIALCQDEPENGMCPSVSRLFRSVATVYGAAAVGVLLTGMGKDGAEELKLLREGGAITIAQDRESSVVYGMPGEAVRLNAAGYVLPLQEIATTLARLLKRT